jgi:hypothetical protein
MTENAVSSLTTTTTRTLHSSSALFNKANEIAMSRTIQLDEAPDGYRGDLTCISFVTDVDIRPIGGHGFPDVSAVHLPDGTRVGTLRTWYGNHGDGKKAEQAFEPADGVKVEYVDWERVA